MRSSNCVKSVLSVKSRNKGLNSLFGSAALRIKVQAADLMRKTATLFTHAKSCVFNLVRIIRFLRTLCIADFAHSARSPSTRTNRPSTT